MFLLMLLVRILVSVIFCFKHKTSYEMRISDWSSDVCSSDLDELGFRKCMLGKHFLIPEDHLAASGAYWHHGTVFLAGVAGATEQIGLASSIQIGRASCRESVRQYV